jgi:hypothetical protein
MRKKRKRRLARIGRLKCHTEGDTVGGGSQIGPDSSRE